MPASRITVRERPTGLLIQVRPRSWLASALLASFLAFWICKLPETQQSADPLGCCTYIILTLILVNSWSWTLFGTEIFLLTPETLVHTLKFGPLSTTREFSVKHISNPHTTEHDGLSRFSFGYGTEFCSIGKTLSSAEANEILAAFMRIYHP